MVMVGTIVLHVTARVGTNAYRVWVEVRKNVVTAMDAVGKGALHVMVLERVVIGMTLIPLIYLLRAIIAMAEGM